MARSLNEGIIVAIGTPRDNKGIHVKESLERIIIDLISKNIHGVLVNGTMGDFPGIRESEYVEIIKTIMKVKGNNSLRVLVGASDNSIEKVLDKVNSLKGMDLDGVVLTTPYYFYCKQSEVVNYFTRIADKSCFPIYVYDIPMLTKINISFETHQKLCKHKKILGCKCSADPIFIRKLIEYFKDVDSYKIIGSRLEFFDSFQRSGSHIHLDGFIGLFINELDKYWDYLSSENWTRFNSLNRKIIRARDEFAKINIFTAYSYAMNLLGYKGNFAPSHFNILTKKEKNKIENIFQQFSN